MQQKTRSFQKFMNRLFEIELENEKSGKKKEKRDRSLQNHKKIQKSQQKICGFQKLSKTFLHWIEFIFLEEEWFKAIYSFKHFLARIQILFQMKNALAWQCCWPFFFMLNLESFESSVVYYSFRNGSQKTRIKFSIQIFCT